MKSEYLGLIEMLTIFGIVLALIVFELLSLKRDRPERDDKTPPDKHIDP
ncbi:MAG: hypothetical protein ABSF50_18660 [Burkholderiaceae bacterium]